MTDTTTLARGQTLIDDGAGRWVVLEVLGTVGAAALVRLQPVEPPEPAAPDETPTRPLVLRRPPSPGPEGGAGPGR